MTLFLYQVYPTELMYQMYLYSFVEVFAMIVNLHDLSPYIFSNIMLAMLNVGAGYVVLSYRWLFLTRYGYGIIYYF